MYKNGEIKGEEFQKGLETAVKTLEKDLGIDVDVRIVKDSSKMPKQSKNSTGSAYQETVNGENRIYINADKISDTSQLIGVMFEEVAHVLDGTAGRQDTSEKVKATNQGGLETLGKPTGDYFEKQYEDSSSIITLKSDENDYSKAKEGSIKWGDFCEFSPNNCKLPTSGLINSTNIKLPKVEMTLEQKRNEKLLVSFILDVIPVVGEVKGIIEAISGLDLISKEEIDLLGRVLNTFPVLSDLKKGFKLLKNIGKAPEVVLADGTRIVLKSDDVSKYIDKINDSKKNTKIEVKNTSKSISHTVKLKDFNVKEIEKLFDVKVSNISNSLKEFETMKKYDDALKDFYKLNSIDIKEIPGKGYYGIIMIGNEKARINVRNISSGGYPTLEIQKITSNSRIKIRYKGGK